MSPPSAKKDAGTQEAGGDGAAVSASADDANIVPAFAGNAKLNKSNKADIVTLLTQCHTRDAEASKPTTSASSKEVSSSSGSLSCLASSAGSEEIFDISDAEPVDVVVLGDSDCECLAFESPPVPMPVRPDFADDALGYAKAGPNLDPTLQWKKNWTKGKAETAVITEDVKLVKRRKEPRKKTLGQICRARACMSLGIAAPPSRVVVAASAVKKKPAAALPAETLAPAEKLAVNVVHAEKFARLPEEARPCPGVRTGTHGFAKSREGSISTYSQYLRCCCCCAATTSTLHLLLLLLLLRLLLLATYYLLLSTATYYYYYYYYYCYCHYYYSYLLLLLLLLLILQLLLLLQVLLSLLLLFT